MAVVVGSVGKAAMPALDVIDATAAALAVRPGEATCKPKSHDRPVEALARLLPAD